MFSWLLYAGHYMHKVFIVVSGLSCTLSAQSSTRLRLVRVLLTGTGSHCLHVSLSWCDLSVLATYLPLKGGSSLLSHNIFLSLFVFCFLSPCFFSYYNASLGTHLEWGKSFWGGLMKERGRIVETVRKRTLWMLWTSSFLFPSQSFTVFLDHVEIRGAAKNYAATWKPLLVII